MEKIESKLNLKWYRGNDEYSEGDIEDKIINLIKDNQEKDYHRVICENFNWSVYYHLINLRQNILNWYPFDADGDVLEIGCGMGAITKVLCDRCKSVTAVEMSKRRATATLLRCKEKENLEVIVGNLNDIEFDKKYDYITLIGVLEYQGSYTNTEDPYGDFLKKIKTLLKPQGRLLIAIENQYGLKYWCGAKEDHTGVPFDGMNQYELTDSKTRTFSKEALDNLIKRCGYKNTYFYYPMPDYKIPTVVYSQDYLPQDANMFNTSFYYIPGNETLIARENEIYKDIIENNVFEFFSNSFLVECSAEDEKLGSIKFASISNKRQPEYQIVTRFTNNNTVEKKSLTKNGRKHLDQILKNESDLEQHNIHVWKSSLNNNCLVTKYCNEPTVEEIVLKYILKKDSDSVYKIFDELYIQIRSSSETVDWEDNILYVIFPQKKRDPQKYGEILKKGYLDMILRNSFLIDNEFWWFDQEWVLENVPAKYPLYRAIKEFYNSYPIINDLITLEKMMNRYEIKEIWSDMEQIEELFMGAVADIDNIRASSSLPGISGQSVVKAINKILS